MLKGTWENCKSWVLLYELHRNGGQPIIIDYSRQPMTDMLVCVLTLLLYSFFGFFRFTVS